MKTQDVARVLLVCVSLLCEEDMQADQLTVTLPANAYQMEAVGGQQRIVMDGFGSTLIPGQPKLPAKTFLVLLPPGAIVNNIRSDAPSTELPGRYAIVPQDLTLEGIWTEQESRQQAMQVRKDEWERNNRLSYSSSSRFPAEPCTYLGQGQWRRYTYARVRFAPFAYYPVPGVLNYSPSCRVTLEYSLPEQGSERWKEVAALSADTVLDDLVEANVVNFNEAKDWYRAACQQQSTRSLSTEQFDYVIIVEHNTMRNAMDPFRKWKEQIGHRVKIVTLDSILTVCSGQDDPEKIWTFLRSNYDSEHWGIRYVLLVGDVNDLPIRFLFPSNSEWAYASDYYYAKLTADWDSDGDKRFGEFTDDNLDPTPDVIVGRIPHGESYVVSSICNRIIAFEKDAGAWKQHTTMAMGISDYNSSGKTDDAAVSEYLKSHLLNSWGWTNHTLYEKNGISPSSYSCDQQLGGANYLSNLLPATSGIITCNAHGNPSGMASQVWTADLDNNGAIDAKTELSYTWFSEIDDIPAAWSSVVFLMGCSTGPPCNTQGVSIGSSTQIVRTPLRNLGRAYIINGAPGVVASTAGSDYHQNWSSPSDGDAQSFNYYLYEQVIAKNRRVGDAFYAAHIEYATNHGLQRGIRVFTYLGDPALNLSGFEDRPGGQDVVIHDGNAYQIGSDYSDGGDMYVGVLSTNPLGLFGKVLLYKSTDHGSTWALWDSVYSRQGIRTFDLLVGEFGSDEFVDNRLLVCCALTDNSVEMHRFSLANKTDNQVVVAAEGSTNDVSGIALARTPIPRAYKVFLTYAVYNSSSITSQVKVCRSLNNGYTWQDGDSYADALSPRIEAGTDNNAYLVMTSDDAIQDVCVAQSTDGGLNWGSQINLTSGDGAEAHTWFQPVIGASTDGAIPTVWVFYPYVDNTNSYDIRYAYSTDAGGKWNTDLVFAGDANNEGHMQCKGYRVSANRWLNVAYIPNMDADTLTNIVWKWTSGSAPEKWSTPRIVNDVHASSGFPPQVIYSPGSSVTGSGVVYYATDNKLYFSAPWLPSKALVFGTLPSLAENLSTVGRMNSATIRFHVAETLPVTVMIHDRLGKLIRVVTDGNLEAGTHELVWDGRDATGLHVAAGQYLCTVLTPLQTLSTSFSFTSDAVPAASVSTTAGAWSPLGEIPRAVAVTSIICGPEGTQFAAVTVNRDSMTTAGSVYKSTDGGMSWVKKGTLIDCSSLTNLIETYAGNFLACGMRRVAGQPRGAVFRSSDHGESWSLTLDFPGVVYDLTETVPGRLFAAAGWSGTIYQSTNDGETWTAVSSLGANVHAYCITHRSLDTLFVGVESPGGAGGVFFAAVGSLTQWQPTQGWANVQAVYDLLCVDRTIYAGVRRQNAGFVYRADPAGEVWTPLPEFTNPHGIAVQCLLSHTTLGLCAGVEMLPGFASSMVWHMPPQGMQWGLVGTTIDLANAVYAMAESSEDLLVGTGYVYGKMFKYSERVVGVRDVNLVPDRFLLGNNYPNPFNPTTTIGYSVGAVSGQQSADSRVRLVVYDILGREVKVLMDEEKEPGKYTMTWDAKELASGVYFYRMTAGAFVQARTMLLLK